MIIVHVFIVVKEGYTEDFISESMENAKKSLMEPGVKRFDIIQAVEDNHKFVLNEVYLDNDSIMAHKETQHYEKWKSAVENMMAEPRKSIKFYNLFPGDQEY